MSRGGGALFYLQSYPLKETFNKHLTIIALRAKLMKDYFPKSTMMIIFFLMDTKNQDRKSLFLYL